MVSGRKVVGTCRKVKLGLATAPTTPGKAYAGFGISEPRAAAAARREWAFEAASTGSQSGKDGLYDRQVSQWVIVPHSDHGGSVHARVRLFGSRSRHERDASGGGAGAKKAGRGIAEKHYRG